jgi:beta-1,4-mannosyltransferase
MPNHNDGAEMTPTNYNAIVVTLGDIGRSPRMCYHALSLAKHGYNVELVGYSATKPHNQILSNAKIRCVPIKPVPDMVADFFPRPLALVVKFIWLLFASLYTLFFCTASSCQLLVMQNPPGIPTMMVCHWASMCKGAAFIIDWHNYTHSILSLSNRLTTRNEYSLRARILNGFVQLASWLEGYWGQKAKFNLCVTKTMQRDLERRWGIKAITVYDKAPAWIFRPLSIEEQHNFLVRFMSSADFATTTFPKSWSSLALSDAKDGEEFGNILMFSRKDTEGHVYLLPNRPLLLVSSTSWTEDEDFGILLDALKDYERQAQQLNNDSLSEKDILPKILVVITGKGPQKEMYMEKISRMKMQNVHVVTAWLAAEDYPKLLACANLGISLHTSTSGLDLPMKVADMFGCHLPVLAKRFEAIVELITEGQAGLLFDTSHELKHSLIELVKGFPEHNQELAKLKKTLSSQRLATWDEHWDAVLWPLLQTLSIAVPHEELKRWQRFQSTDLANDQPDEEDS